MAALSTQEPIGGGSMQGDLGSVEPSAPTTPEPTSTEPDGQSSEPEPKGTTATADPATTESVDTFASTFDPKSIEDKPDLQKAYKQMQGDYTRKMSEVAGLRQYAPLIEQFQQNPKAVIQQLAQQYGVGQGQGPANAGQDFDNFEPQNWGDVISAVKQALLPELSSTIGRQYQPIASKVQEMTKREIEGTLHKIDPEWRNYEPSMTAVLQRHPTMVNDIEALYRMSVPTEIGQAKATQAALAKLKSQTSSSKVSGASQTKTVPQDGPPKGATFAETAEWAKAELARRGIVKP